MKEASGEASMTGITIALIAIIAAVAVPIVNNVISDSRAKAECVASGCVYENGACDPNCDTSSGNSGYGGNGGTSGNGGFSADDL